MSQARFYNLIGERLDEVVVKSGESIVDIKRLLDHMEKINASAREAVNLYCKLMATYPAWRKEEKS